MKIIKLVLLRHGESLWNQENRFTGWTDIDLSNKGHIEAKDAANILKKEGFVFDFGYTSMLKRAIHTLWYILDELDQTWLPVEKSWHLNERHYGALQGLNKIETIKKYGQEQVEQWRRSFSMFPPKITKSDNRFPGYDLKYASLQPEQLPLSESLESTFNRVVPYWKNNILPLVKRGNKVVIVAHGNSLRALIKYLDNINDKEIMKINIPTANPIIYEFATNFKIIKRYYLK
ncbi:2,3-diphosphoglycerate-dependent phosphoglycerate mutase [Candidatus Pantoea edessiphila]|uniref:2,3-bisphosphoglycerate-dependent phosphoglycerate mutase n=1 Tax=Candidatus Pantoea edessiphila TaxID=2044610 RepID=A0A2P5SYZ1_9GAMM|nr:2,3-diphosphoglycerate-dependent phosphoglycerate mutase [Candidatus Pantoea edessiphila]MBK4775305.1 2,3-diphosphoglycerate-dependent phosphoglycerate mutase [Pantoea sp. Edef]PPI87558.1 2,3-diphosphoglycerate-dependent phosphoglycerate mutase [Candidatus Pantoea edessiphila]